MNYSILAWKICWSLSEKTVFRIWNQTLSLHGISKRLVVFNMPELHWQIFIVYFPGDNWVSARTEASESGDKKSSVTLTRTATTEHKQTSQQEETVREDNRPVSISWHLYFSVWARVQTSQRNLHKGPADNS